MPEGWPALWGRGGMADAGDLKSLGFGREGSNPSVPTIWSCSTKVSASGS